MFKNILVFFAFWAFISFSIIAFRSLTKMERWHVSKSIAYGAATAVIAAIILAAIVFAF